MKSICVALVSLTLLCPLVVYAKPTELAEPSLDYSQQIKERSLSLELCAENLRDDLVPLAEELGGWVRNTTNRIVIIIDIRRTCRAIEMSDPPTRFEIIRRDACEAIFQAAVAAETVRLGNDIRIMIQTYPPMVRKSVERFMYCTREETPDFLQFHQMLASMLRSQTTLF